MSKGSERAIIPGRGEVKVVGSGGRYHHAGRQASVKGRQAQWQAGWLAKSMSLCLLLASSRAVGYAVVVVVVVAG
jgi:hypothetical protein